MRPIWLLQESCNVFVNSPGLELEESEDTWMSKEEPCEVITFYSYTGGSGRSMALANVACLLARRCTADRGVLMVDWNLESPSLHRFFQDRVQTAPGAGDPANQFDRQPGLLDLFVELDSQVSKSAPAATAPADFFEQVKPERFVIPTDIPSLFLLKAGRFDDYYFSAVSSFQWAALDERAPWIISSLMDFWAQRYRFILIDSTSGVNDMGGLCAMMIPDKLVTVFTPSRQSLLGVLDVARCAADYRRNSGTTRPLAIFPLPSKIDATEPELRSDWRFGGETGDPVGYQVRFETLFRELEPGCEHPLEEYFNDAQLPYVPRYSYGDRKAAGAKAPTDNCPLARAYRNFAGRLHQTAQPWGPFDASADLSVVEIAGRHWPLAEAEEICLRDIEAFTAIGDRIKAGESLNTLAQIKERLGKPQEAESHYLEAVAVFRAANHKAGVARTVAALGRLERLMGLSEQARIYYLDAVTLYRGQQPNKFLAPTLAVLGDLDAEVGEMEAAEEHYREAIERYQDEWDDIGAAGSLVRLSHLEKRLGALERAEEHCRQAAQLFHKQRDNLGLAGALSIQAEIQNRTGKLEQAEHNYARAAKLYRTERDNLRLAHTLRCLGDVSRTLKKVDQALTHYQESVRLFRADGESVGLATALQSLADLRTRSGGHADAYTLYAEAAVLYRREENNLGVANTLRSLGDLDRRLGRFDAARSNYEQSMELYRSAGNNLGLANSLQSLGDLESRIGKTQEAEERYTQAIQIYRNEGANLGLANALKSLGDVETEAGNLGVAQDHYEQAIELYRAGGKTLGLANALQRLGDLKRLQKRFNEATGHYSTARDLYRQEHHMSGLAYTCSELARVSHALFDFTGSIEYLNEAASAAKDSNAPAVIEYVWDVRREIRGEPAIAR
jgi:tetratricopeptide (TPR) repeat protein/cellulose biosynthesis protein BcsQ